MSRQETRARRVRLVAVPGAAVVVLSALCARRLERVVVAGTSMVPTLVPGDRLLIWRGTGYRADDLVVVGGRGPRTADRAGDAVKRVVSVGDRDVVVAGDNPAASTDSRDYGPVPLADVRGRVVYRYAPAGRTGRLTRGPARNRG